MIELALQGLLVGLLLLTITWCVIVHYRLRRLRTDRGELEAFIAALGEATGRAEAVVRQMREANAAVEGTARDQERRASRQTAELARLLDNAVRVINRLDAAVEQGATRVAELRTAGAGVTTEAASRPSADRQSARPQHRPSTATPAAAARPSVMPDSGTSEARAAPAARLMRPVRGEGRLDGLLHGELREALQGLR